MADTTNTDTTAASGAASLGPIQRFNLRAGIVNPEANGLYVRYVDHVEHVESARAAAPAAQEAEPATETPEGCTPADARMLRKANHALAAESFELQTALRGIVAQAGKALARFDIAPQAPAAPTAAAAEAGELDLDRVLQLADEHADDSREDGTRVIDRGGLLAFAKDLIRIFAAAPAPAAGAAPIGTITQSYTVAKIRELVASGDYSADLMLQHALLHLGAGAAPTDARWWRKRADEIELAVARSGSPEAMSYYTDMRTLMQAVALGAAAPAQEAEDAARYRWLRDETEWEPFDSAWLCKMDIYGCPSRAMDAAIDAARARQEGQA